MTFPQKHEDQPIAPALSRGSRQGDSYATPHGPDPEDVETAIANLEPDRSGLDAHHDASMDRSQGTSGLDTSAPSNPTLLELPGLRDATKTNITENVGPETQSFREKRIQPVSGSCLTPTLWGAWCPAGGLDSVMVFCNAVAASVTSLTGMPYGNCIIEPLTPPPSPPESSACSSIGDGQADDARPHSLSPVAATTREYRQAEALWKWRSWARYEKFLKDEPLRLRTARLEARRKSLSSPPEASSTTVASIPDPPPKYVPPGTKSFCSPPETSAITAADPLLPKYAPPRIPGSVPAMGEVAAVASRPTSPSTSLPRDAILPENTALGAPDTASMVGKIPDLASRPSSPGLEDIPDPGDDRPSLAASPPPPRRHDYQTLLPHSLDAPSPRHIDPTLPPHSLAASPPPPRRHDYPTSPPDRPDASGARGRCSISDTISDPSTAPWSS